MRCQNCEHEFEAFPGEPCPRCGHSAPLSADSPPVPPPGSGGQTGEGTGGGDAAAPTTPPPPSGPPRDGPPWERERSVGSLFQTLKGVLLEPSATFRSADPEAGIGWALLYWLILTFIGLLFATFWNVLAQAAGLGGIGQYREMFPELDRYLGDFGEATTAMSLLYVAFVPVSLAMGTLFLFVWAGIVHLLLMMVGGANRGFEATFRAMAYGSGSATLFQIIPVCGGWIAMIWSIVVQIIGVKELHETSGGKATFSILGPLLFCCACGFFLVLAIIFMIAGAASS